MTASVASRAVAGITVPDTPLIARALERARSESEANFTRDFGERLVPGYKPASTVDLLMNAPFAE